MSRTANMNQGRNVCVCVCALKHLFKFRHIKHFSAQWLQREMPHTSAHLTQFFHHISFNTVLSINTLFVFSKYRFLFIARKPCNLCYCLKPWVLLWNGITFFLETESLRNYWPVLRYETKFSMLAEGKGISFCSSICHSQYFLHQKSPVRS